MSCHLFAIKHNPANLSEFKSPDSLEANFYKPMILTWLASRYGIKYIHSFRDKFISFHAYEFNDTISISLDLRDENQQKLFKELPEEIKGCRQKGTGKLVNKTTIYIPHKDLFELSYPQVVNWKLFHTEKSKDNDGDDFYSYTWKIFLSDNTVVYSSNNSNSQLKDIKVTEDWVLSKLVLEWMIQTRTFLDYILKEDLKYRYEDNKNIAY